MPTEFIEEGPFLLESVPARTEVLQAPRRTAMTLSEVYYASRNDALSVYGMTVVIGSLGLRYDVVGWEDDKLQLVLQEGQEPDAER